MTWLGLTDTRTVSVQTCIHKFKKINVMYDINMKLANTVSTINAIFMRYLKRQVGINQKQVQIKYSKIVGWSVFTL